MEGGAEGWVKEGWVGLAGWVRADWVREGGATEGWEGLAATEKEGWAGLAGMGMGGWAARERAARDYITRSSQQPVNLRCHIFRRLPTAGNADNRQHQHLGNSSCDSGSHLNLHSEWSCTPGRVWRGR